MGQTITNATSQTSSVLKINKQQIRRFFQFILVIGLFTVTFLAIRINSPLLKPLLFVEIIGTLIYLMKTSKSNTVIYKK